MGCGGGKFNSLRANSNHDHASASGCMACMCFCYSQISYQIEAEQCRTKVSNSPKRIAVVLFIRDSNLVQEGSGAHHMWVMRCSIPCVSLISLVWREDRIPGPKKDGLPTKESKNWELDGDEP